MSQYITNRKIYIGVELYIRKLERLGFVPRTNETHTMIIKENGLIIDTVTGEMTSEKAFATLSIHEILKPLSEKYYPLSEQAHQRYVVMPDEARGKKAAEAEVAAIDERMRQDGYFEDSLFADGVLATLGMSWETDVRELCDKRGKLHGEKLRVFRELVSNGKQQLPSMEELRATRPIGDKRLHAWRENLFARRAELMFLLDPAIDRNLAVELAIY